MDRGEIKSVLVLLLVLNLLRKNWHLCELQSTEMGWGSLPLPLGVLWFCLVIRHQSLFLFPVSVEFLAARLHDAATNLTNPELECALTCWSGF